ncbi:hypothetical protein FS799_21705 [Agrobacterium vitis]|uniref:YchJ family protein n=1 Tax=Agrobacterium vitis TaxID=373 RepID=UPI002E35EA80|nr:YchJ family metal-binding protein [Agrobacterium vitis]MCE6077465.1 hypothetical protein [Agrobacterium vitis]
MLACACGSNFAYDECCGPYILGKRAPTPETLMRSRYTAFTVGKLDYVERTSTEHAQEFFNRTDMEASLPQTEWLGLEIRGTTGGEEADSAGTVLFAFKYRFQDRSFSQVERGTFLKVDGRWLFDRSEINPRPETVRVQQIGRNEPCPCGSGKKYKKCCAA